MHWLVVKRILRYLKAMADMGLKMQRTNSMHLNAFSDADWACCSDDRRLQVDMLCV